MWSIGVIAYFLLSGKPPFLGKDDKEVQNKIVTCNYSFDDKVWTNHISEDAQDWVEGMLDPNSTKRLDTSKALNHKWLKNSNQI